MNDNWLTPVIRHLKKPVTGELFGTPVTIRLYVIFIVFLTVVGFFLGRYQLYQGRWYVLESKQYGYSIVYPANWAVKKYEHKVSRAPDYMRASFGNFFSSKSLHIYEHTVAEPSLMKAAEWGEEIIERQGGYNLSDLERGEIGYGNYQALTRTFMENGLLGVRVLNNTFYIAADDRVYMLEFAASERSYKESSMIFDTMLDSFRLLEIMAE